MKTDTPTPRTDAEIEQFDKGWSRVPVSPDFARQLERENAELVAALRKSLYAMDSVNSNPDENGNEQVSADSEAIAEARHFARFALARFPAK